MLALTGLRISEIISRKIKIGRKSFPFIFLGAVLIFSLIPNYPLLTGDFNGNLKTVNLPRDFEDSLNEVIKSKKPVSSALAFQVFMIIAMIALWVYIGYVTKVYEVFLEWIH